MVAAARGGRGRGWLTVHGWLGLALTLFMLLVLATGTVATLSHEIEWLYSDRVRAEAAGGPESWEGVLAAARRTYPDRAFGYVSAGPGPAFAWRVSGTREDGAWRDVFVDPATMRVTGEAGLLRFPMVMRQLHYQLLTSTSLALYAVCALSFLLAGSLASGLTLSKRFWRGFFRLRAGRGWRVFWGDLHRFCGVWSIWFALAMAATGLWYLAERAMQEASGYSVELQAGPAVLAPPQEASAPPPVVGIAAAVAAARRALPALEVRTVELPRSALRPYVVFGQTGAALVRDRAARVVVHPVTGAVLGVRHPGMMGLAERWAHMADPLHFGDFAGLASKLVWAAFGAVLTAVAASGLVVWIRRTSRAGVTPGVRRPAMRPFWAVNAALLALPLAALPAFVRNYGEGPQVERDLGQGAPRAEAVSAVLVRDFGRPALLVRFCAGCFDAIRQAEATILLNGGETVTRRLGDDPNRLTVLLPDGRSADDVRSVTLRTTEWSGRRAVVRWPEKSSG